MKAGPSRCAAGWLFLAAATVAAGCHGAEAFLLTLDAGNIFVSQGTGGTGGDVISGPGTGGGGSGSGEGGADIGAVAGNEGGADSDGAPGPDAGELDAGPATDVAPLPDALPDRAREVRLPEGPFTPIDCLQLTPYKPDDVTYGPGKRIFSLRDLRVYRCMDGPPAGWCTIGAYEPGLDIGYWRDCWIPIGYCQ